MSQHRLPLETAPKPGAVTTASGAGAGPGAAWGRQMERSPHSPKHHLSSYLTRTSHHFKHLSEDRDGDREVVHSGSETPMTNQRTPRAHPSPGARPPQAHSHTTRPGRSQARKVRRRPEPGPDLSSQCRLPERCPLLRRLLATCLSSLPASQHSNCSIFSQVTQELSIYETAEPACLPDKLTTSQSCPKVSGSGLWGSGGAGLGGPQRGWGRWWEDAFLSSLPRG